MVTKEMLSQYYHLKQEEIELGMQIEATLTRIDSCEEEIRELERELVLDKVYGGFGGEQGFVIEGYDERDLKVLRTRLIRNKEILAERLALKRKRKDDNEQMLLEIERFLNTISDSFIRRIIYYRFLEHMPWEKVAEKVGGSNTEDSVRKALDRFLEKQ